MAKPKQTVLDLYKKLATYCISKNQYCSDIFYQQDSNGNYTSNLYKAIESYYNNSSIVNESMCAVVRGMNGYLSGQMLIYANDETLGISHSTEGFSTLSQGLADCWYKWSWLEDSNSSHQAFYNKILMIEDATDTDASGNPKQKPSGEQLQIDLIIDEINEARSNESTDLETFADTFWTVGNRNGLIGMFEERGGVIATPNKKVIAKTIYVDSGLYDLIKQDGLDVPIPSYIDEIL